MPPTHESRSLPWFHRACRLAIDVVSRAVWGFGVRGLEHVPDQGPLIIAGNHASWVDSLLLFCAVYPRREIHFLAKAELFENRLSSWFFRKSGCIPLHRGHGDPSAMRDALGVLEGGGCLGIFPQGTRARAGNPPRLKPGLGFLAALSGAAVVPTRLVNTERFPLGRPLEVRFGPSLRFSGDSRDRKACLEFASLVMARISEL